MNTDTLPTVTQKELPAPNRIRVETALSRFPIHCLSRKGSVTIDLHRFNEVGEPDFRWEVTFNSKHGQPGPLAYKIDTLIINRLLDGLGRPLPEIVRIGSLSDVCRSLGTQDTGPNITNLKSAFLQNASAFINAKIRYKTKTGREKWAEMGYTRYSVVFTGEALPDGTQADAVYIVLNPPYRELLNHVETRPLDYDYLKKLPPGPQRLYELLSFQIYGSIAGSRARAKVLYSDYCKYAPQVRYCDFDHVKKQMYKLHVLHRESGYINKIEYHKTTDGDGKADWEIFYTPGPKAFVEYQAFTNRYPQHPTLRPPEQSARNDRENRRPSALQAALDLTGNSNLVDELTRRGIGETKARDLLNHLAPGQEVTDQLEYVDSLIFKDKKGKYENPPGLYITYVRDNIRPASNFVSSRKARLQKQEQELKNADIDREGHLEAEYEAYCDTETERHVRSLSSAEYQRLFEQQSQSIRVGSRLMSSKQLEAATHQRIRALLRRSDRVEILSFDEFVKKRNTAA